MYESCPRCGSKEFAIARDMVATRHCKCGATWLPVKDPPAPTGEDERDAWGYAEGAGFTRDSYTGPSIAEAFLAGRKGMVPAADVDRLRVLYDDLNLLCKIRLTNVDKQIAEAVKREREKHVREFTIMKRQIELLTENMTLLQQLKMPPVVVLDPSESDGSNGSN